MNTEGLVVYFAHNGCQLRSVMIMKNVPAKVGETRADSDMKQHILYLVSQSQTLLVEDSLGRIELPYHTRGSPCLVPETNRYLSRTILFGGANSYCNMAGRPFLELACHVQTQLTRR